MSANPTFLSASSDALPKGISVTILAKTVSKLDDFKNRLSGEISKTGPMHSYNFKSAEDVNCEFFSAGQSESELFGRTLLYSPLRGLDLMTNNEKSLFFDAAAFMFFIGYDTIVATPKIGEGFHISLSDPEFSELWVELALEFDRLHRKNKFGDI